MTRELTKISSELVVLGLGSNRGDSRFILESAVASLQESLSDLELSPLYSSDPLYVLDQPPYLNAAVSGIYSGSPYELLAFVNEVEALFGRNRSLERRRGERTLDIDILLFGDLRVDDPPRLVIPHPQLTERKFALLPLLNLLPEQREPGTGRLYRECLDVLCEQGIYYASLEPYNQLPGGIHGSCSS